MTSLVGNKGFKSSFETNQLIPSTVATRNFSSIRKQAKKSPLLILDNNNPDSVLLSIEDYNSVVALIETLEEEIFELKVVNQIKNIESESSSKMKFSDFANEEDIQLLKEVEDWNVSDDELFE